MVEENDVSDGVLSFLQELDKRFQIPPQPTEALIPLNPYR